MLQVRLGPITSTWQKILKKRCQTILVPKCSFYSNKGNAYPHLIFLVTTKGVVDVCSLNHCCTSQRRKPTLSDNLELIPNIATLLSLVSHRNVGPLG